MPNGQTGAAQRAKQDAIRGMVCPGLPARKALSTLPNRLRPYGYPIYKALSEYITRRLLYIHSNLSLQKYLSEPFIFIVGMLYRTLALRFAAQTGL